METAQIILALLRETITLQKQAIKKIREGIDNDDDGIFQHASGSTYNGDDGVTLDHQFKMIHKLVNVDEDFIKEYFMDNFLIEVWEDQSENEDDYILNFHQIRIA